MIEALEETGVRELFENHLMGYALCTDRCRLIIWRDHCDLHADSVDVERFDHVEDPRKTVNVAAIQPQVVERLSARLRRKFAVENTSIE